jgi:hypothetical protein
MSVYVVIAQLHRDVVDHCVRPVAAITAAINVPKHWDELTPECCLVAIGLGCCEEAPRFAAGKLARPGVIQCRPSRFSCGWATTGVVSSAGELIDVRAGAGMGF